MDNFWQQLDRPAFSLAPMEDVTDTVFREKVIIQATKEGTNLPVSVKTRTGIKQHQTEEWVSHLLETEPAAIILHGRTQRMQSEGDASWDEIAKAVKVKNQLNPNIPLHGNGDVFSYSDGLKKATETGADGIMVGRGIFQNPWYFNPEKIEISEEERIEKLIQHTRLFEQTWGGIKNFNILKRFYKIYLNSFPGAAKLRADLMEVKDYEEVYRYLKSK